MENFEVIYKILSYLEKAMDYDEVNTQAISAEKLLISINRWSAIIEMLAKNKYVDGVNIYRPADGGTIIDASNIHITLTGLEYLKNNANMHEVKKS